MDLILMQYCLIIDLGLVNRTGLKGCIKLAKNLSLIMTNNQSMKQILILLLTTSSFLYGGVKIPKYVYSINDLEQAQLEAKEKSKVVAFVYSDAEST